jgi:hypothetical protein
LLSAVSGTILPGFFERPMFYHLMNVLWGFIYGLGWYVAGFFDDVGASMPALFGGIVWPVVVSICLWVLYGRVYDAQPATRRWLLAVIAVSFLLVVPEKFWSITPLRWVPTWSGILNSIY